MTFPLTPIGRRNSLSPGKCVLIRYPVSLREREPRPRIHQYWIAVICREARTPRGFRRRKRGLGRGQQVADPYPAWVAGKPEFLWLSRDQMFELEDAHRDAYRASDENSGFMSFFTLARDFDCKPDQWDPFIMQNRRIVERRERRAEMAIVGTKRRRGSIRGRGASRRETIIIDDDDDDDDDDDGEDDSHLEDSDYEGPVSRQAAMWPPAEDQHGIRDGKSATVTTWGPELRIPSPPLSMAVVPSTPPLATASSTDRQQFIKGEQSDDDDDHALNLPTPPAAKQQGGGEEMIDIYVGPTNSRFTCSRSNITRSPVLREGITQRNNSSAGQSRAFIMDPTFSTIEPADFSALIDFLATDGYDPILLPCSSSADARNASDGDDDAATPSLILDSSTGPVTPSTHLLRSARLFNLAKRFQVPAFAALVIRKILHGRCRDHRERTVAAAAVDGDGDDDETAIRPRPSPSPSPRYEVDAFLGFAWTVLGWQGPDFDEQSAQVDRQDEIVQRGSAGAGADAGAAGVPKVKDALESWTIRFLAENMPVFCSSTSSRCSSICSPTSAVTGPAPRARKTAAVAVAVPGAAFWEVMALQRHDVERRVFEVKLELCRLFPGGRVKVEEGG